MVTQVEVTAIYLPFDEVYRTHCSRVYLFCLSQVRNRAEAEDLAADVFESAYAAYERTRPGPDAVLPWLLRIARNATIDMRRKQRRRTEILRRILVRTAEGGDDDSAVERQVILREDAHRALECARRLTPRDRTLIGLRIVVGLSHAEIGQVLGISQQAAAVAAGRALQRLRRLYEAAP